MDFFARRHQNRRFAMPLGYYVSNFYLHVWGLLDQLTVIANLAFGLGLRDRDCGITYKDFWKTLAKRRPAPATFIERTDISEWIGLIADMRHAGAHHSSPVAPGGATNDKLQFRPNKLQSWPVWGEWYTPSADVTGS
jgi:hypothetical protein